MTLANRLAKLEAIAAQRQKQAQADLEFDITDVLERCYRLLANGSLAWQAGCWAAGPTVAQDDRFGADMGKLASVMNSAPKRFTAEMLLAWAEAELGRDPWEQRRLAEVRQRL